jgi:hypothetical protein
MDRSAALPDVASCSSLPPQPVCSRRGATAARQGAKSLRTRSVTLMHDPIAIELDDDGKWIVFRRTQREQSGDFARGLLELPPRFTLADVCEAALATGLVVAKNNQFFLDAATGCKALAVYIDGILGYFEAAGSPGPALARVIQEIHDHFDLDQDLPLWCYAWLDLVVHDDIAEAARSESQPWRMDRLVLELAALRDRRVTEVIEAHRAQAAGGGTMVWERSQPPREDEDEAQHKTG